MFKKLDLIMVTEDYVSFEKAKLLKEKGFNEKCFRTYFNDGIISRIFDDKDEIYNENLLPSVVAAPTLQMAMKWLREKHNLFVFPFPQMNTSKYWAEIYQLSNGQEWVNLYCETIDLQNYSSYEEACEAAIKYCLEYLI